MHRKDYEAFARVIRATRDECADEEGIVPLVAVKMAAVFAADNQHFQHDRFMVACGFPKTGGPA